MGNKRPITTDAKTALSIVEDGDTIAIGHATGEPQHLTKALSELCGQIKNIRTIHMMDMGESFYTTKEAEGSFRHSSLFVGGKTREALMEGRADYIPVHFSNIPELFWNGIVKTDVALVQVSPPDKHGYMSLGVSVDYTYAAAYCAKTLIVQVNSEMPRVHGDCFVHVSDVDYIVEHNESLIELKNRSVTDVHKKIGEQCASLIQDGDTLQLGVGALPNAILDSLKDKNDLGIHTEMFSDGVIDLVEAKVINNSKKTLHRNKMVASFVMGSHRLYEFIDDNPSIYLAPVEYVNDPYIIAKNDNMVSINSCLQIDLNGQVGSESLGLQQISATGGQVDFVRGANMSKNGKSLIATASTIADGTISKIVPVLDEGAAVTTLRNDISYVVTEYGIANLKGKSLRERGKELIRIAHPTFRDELTFIWENRFKMSIGSLSN